MFYSATNSTLSMSPTASVSANYSFHSSCNCPRNFYEDDELCRLSPNRSQLEFGIVSPTDDPSKINVYWTLNNEIENETIDLNNHESYAHLHLIDRSASPGDLITINKKQGEVLDVSYLTHAIILETDTVLLDIPTTRLTPLHTYTAPHKLLYKSWIGTITSTNISASVILPKGTTVVLTENTSHLYPGQKLSYSIADFEESGVSAPELEELHSIYGTEDISSFVLFVNVASVTVAWNGRIHSDESKDNQPITESPPPKALTRVSLKKHGKLLGSPNDVNWDDSPEALERLYTLTVKQDDLVVQNSTKGFESYMINKYYQNDIVEPQTVSQVSSKLVTNNQYTVRVLRFSRVLRVRWLRSGKVDTVRASDISSKTSFPHPFRQLVQRKVSLCPFTTNEYGVTMTRGLKDQVNVTWLTKATSGVSSDFKKKYTSSESIYDLEPHFTYGTFSTGDIVYRSDSCHVPDHLFKLGWIRKITVEGQLIVFDPTAAAQEYSLYPDELNNTNMKISDTPPPTPIKSLCSLHDIRKLSISDQIFISNINTQIDWSNVPDAQHFAILSKAPSGHSFYQNVFRLTSNVMEALSKDQRYLTTTFINQIGTIWIKAFRDRPDLFCVLMSAPKSTNYYGALYTFDIQLGPNYPNEPPAICLTTCLAVNNNDLKPGIVSLGNVDNVYPPHELVPSLIAVQTKLFTNPVLDCDIPSSAASLHRRQTELSYGDRQPPPSLTVDVLDLLFRQVMDPPKLWILEVIRFFHMSYPTTKARVMDLILKYDESPDDTLTEGLVDALSNRIKRFEELLNKN